MNGDGIFYFNCIIVHKTTFSVFDKWNIPLLLIWCKGRITKFISLFHLIFFVLYYFLLYKHKKLLEKFWFFVLHGFTRFEIPWTRFDYLIFDIYIWFLLSLLYFKVHILLIITFFYLNTYMFSKPIFLSKCEALLDFALSFYGYFKNINICQKKSNSMLKISKKGYFKIIFS